MKHLRLKIIISIFIFVVGVISVTFWLIKSKPGLNFHTMLDPNVYSTPDPNAHLIRDSNVYSISFCDLMRESKHYDGKIIETNVTYRQGFEAAFFTDSDCNKESITIACPFDSDEKSCNKILKSMDKYIKTGDEYLNSSKVKFTVIGRYHDSAYDSFDGYVHQIQILEVKDNNTSQVTQ